MGPTRVLGGILLFALLDNPVRTLSATLPGSSSVALAWNTSPSLGVTGYRVHYGAASGSYTNSVVVGNLTTGTVSGLAGGVTYFFAVAAYNASGPESDLSNSFSYAVTGQIGHTYEIHATQDFKTWTFIGTGTPGASGSVTLNVGNAASFPKRFYRTRGP